MRYRLTLFLAAIVAVSAQSPPARTQNAKAWVAPRAPDGHPDLQGFWTSASLTPFERPAEYAGKEFFTEAEAAEFERRQLDAANRDRRPSSPEADVALAYNEAWFERGTKLSPSRRTSIVIDPPDGRVPPLTPEARKAAAARAEIGRRAPTGPQDFSLPIRCIQWPTAGPPMVPGPYNNNYQIVQAGDYVAINVEMIHDARIIPLNRRQHPGPGVRLWMGDSIGHWEGDTLVVDTTNFSDKTNYRGADQKLHLTERFTRTSPDTLVYRFTVDDPTAFTRPWTGEITMVRFDGPLYEYACHEGNYSLTTMLRAARMAEKEGQK